MLLIRKPDAPDNGYDYDNGDGDDDEMMMVK